MCSQFITNIFGFLFFFYLIVVFMRRILPKRVISTNRKAVLITGCDSGFGNRLALRLNQIGFRVYATVLNTDSPGAQHLKRNAVFVQQMIVLQMNVKNSTEVNEIFITVKRDLKSTSHKLWALVNNAAIITFGPLEWGSLDSFNDIFKVNVFGTVRVTRVFLSLIKESKGRVINISSFGGRFAVSYCGIYCMSKHSLTAFSDTLRREMNKFNIKVILIEPGYFNTNIISKENIVNQMDIIWRQSSEIVQNSYGNYELQKRLILKLLTSFPAEDNIDIVVDDIIDAIINWSPKIRYTPSNFSFKLLSLVLMSFPTQPIDWILALNERLVNKWL